LNNNDILRQIRYIFDFSDVKLVSLFALAGLEVTREQVSSWLKKEDDADFQPCTDPQFARFLDGLIIDRRGPKEGTQSAPELQLTNNMIFRKLRIALDLKAEDVLEILRLAKFSLSNHELSAFFRRADHKHYRECKDQVLRNFLKGLQLKYRPQK